MIILDLISPQEKKQFHTKNIYLVIEKLVFISSLLFIINISITLMAKHIIKNNLSNIDSQNIAITEGNKELNQQIKNFNSEIGFLSFVQNENIFFTDLFLKIINLTPKNITLTHLSFRFPEKIEKKNNILNLEIKGLAATREDLISYKEKINSSNFLKDIKLSINDLLFQENVKFELSTELYLNQ
ncbi:MAG: hypothetical protein U9O66_02880 [Patescibacteria group bacterium]|nr:hypothetical protein [Patescibacteria group bacterium]